MTDEPFLDFELRIAPAGEAAYQAIVQDAPSGQVRVPCLASQITAGTPNSALNRDVRDIPVAVSATMRRSLGLAPRTGGIS